MKIENNIIIWNSNQINYENMINQGDKYGYSKCTIRLLNKKEEKKVTKLWYESNIDTIRIVNEHNKEFQEHKIRYLGFKGNVCELKMYVFEWDE